MKTLHHGRHNSECISVVLSMQLVQDPETQPATRGWPSIDVGTEIFNGQKPVTAEWTVSDFDVLFVDTPGGAN